MITIFNDLFKTETPFFKDVDYAFDLIRNNKDNALIKAIRIEPDKEKRNALKKRLKCICFSGKFSKRKAINIIEHSGIACLDWDNMDDPLDFKAKLMQNEYIYSAFISPSGNGVKALVKVPPEIKNYKAYYETISENFDSTNDQHTSNIASVCYESYDPDIYVNEDSKVWVLKKEFEAVQKNTDVPKYFLIDGVDKRVDVILKWWNKKFTMNQGERNSNLFKLAASLNEAGMYQDDCFTLFTDYYSNGLPESEVKNIVKSAYSNTEKFNTLVLIDRNKIEKVYTFSRKGSDHAKKKLIKEGVPITEIEEALEYEFEDDFFIFWDTHSKSGKISLNDYKFKIFLENRGFYKVQLNEREFTFVKVLDNIIKEVNERNIKDFVLDYVKEEGIDIYNFFARATNRFSEMYLNMLDTRDLLMLRDSSNESYLFFLNTILRITKNKIDQIEYIDCGGLVWERNIIQREWKSCSIKSDFEQFIINVTNNEADRLKALECSIGYLLNSYKRQDEGVAIVLYDETLNDNPSGRTGKTVVSKAISELRKVTTLNGKEFNSKGQFPYQTVNLDDNVLCFDDITQNFSFEELFNIITGDLTLNKKNLQPIVIPYERSPKILFTSNYILKGVGDSHEARKVEIELHRHYSKSFQPIDDFKKRFFSSDWNNEEWNSFYSYMIANIQKYLSFGLVKTELKTAKIRKVISGTSDDFFDYCENKIWDENTAYKTKELFEEYKSGDEREVPKNMGTKWFGRWLSLYFEYKEFKREDSNHNGERYFNLTNIKDQLPF